jgi:lipopolysaccharide biosynthesis glycosyltransferase
VTVLDIACASSEMYVAHGATMLHSALATRGDCELRVHYLIGPGFSADARSRLEAMVRRDSGTIRFHEIADERVAGLKTTDQALPPQWYRIYLPELLPEVQRILYLDVDLLVLESLGPLAEIDLRAHHLAGVANVWEPWNAGYPAALGLPPTQPYFNSGVLLMNLELMRADRSSTALYEWAIAHRETLWLADQDALNAVLGADHLELHPRWNCMNSVLLFPEAIDVFGAERTEQARRNPAIRHFEGPSENKPWHLLCERDGIELYRHHRRQTPWPRYIPDGITPRNVLRRGAVTP